MKLMMGLIGAVAAFWGSTASAQGLKPVHGDEGHDSEIVYTTVTTLAACGTSKAELDGIGNRFGSWMSAHTINGRPATESYMARTGKAMQAYRNPATKAFLCGRASSGKARMITDAGAAMKRLEGIHTRVHKS